MEHELLLEIGTEELPASFVLPALRNLEKILAESLDNLMIPYGAIKTGGTPRRLTIAIENLASHQPDRRDEVMGPPQKAAFNENNEPTKAAIGFVKSRGASLDDIQIVKTPKGEYLMIVAHIKGEETYKLLQEILPAAISSLPFPKSMRWGSGKIPFARPIKWIVAMYQGSIVPFSINAVKSSNTCKGHRFMAPETFEVVDFNQYSEELKNRYVIFDPEARKEVVVREARKIAQNTGGQLLDDSDLAGIVTNLVEYPFPVCGTFEERFLQLPKDVLITSMREHQKYFAVVDEQGNLLPYFVAVNNTSVKDQKIAAEGHQRVLRARLEDALFFFEEDKKKSLDQRIEDLKGIVFQTKLGTMREKTARLAILSEKLAMLLDPDAVESSKQSALLSKVDLLTDMVNEFPSLQGIMGREYALLENNSPEVAQAIYEHYLPVRAGSKLPESIAGAFVSMADRIDTITGCFGIGQSPSGAADPFGLRRLALGLIHIIEHKGFHFPLRDIIKEAILLYGEKLTEPPEQTEENILNFIKARFNNDFTRRGIAPETVEAVTSITFEDINDCRLRIEALANIQEEPKFKVLAGSFKRVINITKDQGAENIDESLLKEQAERILHEKLQDASKSLQPLLLERNYREAMNVILTMKEPIDSFFDEVMVMTDDRSLRNNRLALLSDIGRLFFSIGDFSKMYAIAS